MHAIIIPRPVEQIKKPKTEAEKASTALEPNQA